MITIKPSPTADTRTCDWSKVTKEELLKSSRQHINDVSKGMQYFAERFFYAALVHDEDKIVCLEDFYEDFQTGFKETGWWDKHRKINRHHLNVEDGVPEDVNLIDVMEYIVDCVMAGMARSGIVTPLSLSDELLQKAFQNTVELLKKTVQLGDKK